MSDLLIGASVLSLLFAVIMAVIVARLLRENRARSTARVQELQALVADEAPMMAASVAPARAAAEVDRYAEAAGEEDWDRVLGDVRAPKFELRSSTTPPLDHPLFEESAHQTPSRRWIWIPATGVVMALGIGGFYAMSSGVLESATNPAAATAVKPAAAPAAPIELLSLRHSIETPGAFVVTGLVQNPATSVSIRGAFAVVYLFDEEGRYFASSKAALDADVLSPGGETAFTVRVAPASALSTADVRRYRVSFQQADGAAVHHVDKRGALPEGTTGSAVETAPSRQASPAQPSRPMVTARKRG